MVRDATQNFRLPVDRSFVMPGFGTVVTGTVAAGSVALKMKFRRIRVPSCFVSADCKCTENPSNRAIAGQRAALNVAGVGAAGPQSRHDAGTKGAFAPTALFDGAIELLTSAKPLKNRAPVHFHTGTAEVQAEIRTLDHASTIEPGSTAFVRIVLSEPLLLVSWRPVHHSNVFACRDDRRGRSAGLQSSSKIAESGFVDPCATLVHRDIVRSHCATGVGSAGRYRGKRVGLPDG